MKSKLGFILKGYPRLSETFIAQEIRLLELQGFEIEIFSMRSGRETERQPIVGLIKAPVTYIPEYILPALVSIGRENWKAFLRYPKRYLRLLARACRLNLAIWTDNSLKRFLQAGWLVGRQRLGDSACAVQHLHAHFAHAPAELAWWTARLTGLRYSISAHAKDIYTLPTADLLRRVSDCELVMTCTAYNVERIRALVPTEQKKVHLVYHGLDLSVFRAQARAPWTAERLSNIISVGRLVTKKGYDDIFSALQRLKAKGRSFHYDIYGAGEQLQALQILRDNLGLRDEIVFHRATTQPKIVARLQEGGIFLCGSRITADGDRDGIPNTLAEAMAMELPVIATQVSGIPELVQDGINGILVQEQRPDLLALAIESLLDDTAKADRISSAARARVESVFDSQSWIKECARLLQPFTEQGISRGV